MRHTRLMRAVLMSVRTLALRALPRRFLERRFTDHQLDRVRHGATAPFALVCLALALLATLLGGCNLPLLSGRSSSAAAPTATALATLAPSKGADDVAALAVPAASATHCSQVPGFESAPAASAGAAFTDVPFPRLSVGAVGAPLGSLYVFQLVTVCAEGAGAQSVLAFYTSQMSTAGWAPSATYPYGGDPTHTCGDPYCWRKATPTARYVSLERMNGAAAVTVYTLRLATAPTPKATLAIRSAIGTARPGGSVTVSASCQAGEQLLGGGYSITISSYSARSSYPSAAATWTASASATGSSPFELQTYVGCLTANYSLGVQIVTATLSAASGTAPAAIATCPSGVVTGGGGQISGAGALLAESAPTGDGKAWSVVAAGANDTQGVAYAVCATHNLDVAPSTKRAFTVESGNDAQASLACLPEQWLTSGGFSNSDPSADGKNVFSLDGPTADNSRWFLQAHNLDPASAHSATIWATCVRPDPQL